MTLFRSELLPFHPPRYRSRVGQGLARYGRVRGAHAHSHVPDERARHMHASTSLAVCSATTHACGDTLNLPAAQAQAPSQIAFAA